MGITRSTVYELVTLNYHATLAQALLRPPLFLLLFNEVLGVGNADAGGVVRIGMGSGGVSSCGSDWSRILDPFGIHNTSWRFITIWAMFIVFLTIS